MTTVVDLLKQYLLQTRSVTLKNLGQFSLEQVSASVHPVLHEFKPPSVIILFEEQKHCETNNEFLMFVSEKSAISKDDATTKVIGFVDEIQDVLKTETTYAIQQLGVFKRNPDHSLSFVFDEDINILPQTYGMPVFVIGEPGKKISTNPVSVAETIPDTEVPTDQSEQQPEDIPLAQNEAEPVLQNVDEPKIPEETQMIEQVAPPIAIEAEQIAEAKKTELPGEKEEHEPEKTEEQPEPIKVQEANSKPVEPEQLNVQKQQTPPDKKKKKRFVVPLIILVVLCAAGASAYFTGYWEILYNKILPAKVTQQDPAEQISEVIETTEEQPVGPIAENKEVIPETEIEEEAIPQKAPPAATAGAKYFIVADCFKYIELAEKRVQALQSEGFSSVLAGQTKQGLHIVAYSGFATREQAEEELKKIKADKNPHAWLYVK